MLAAWIGFLLWVVHFSALSDLAALLVIRAPNSFNLLTELY